MATAAQYLHLTIAADGSVRIGDSRYKVIHVAAEHYHHGWSAEELLRQHPDLRPEEVYSALAYFYDHHDELVEQIAATASIKSPSSNLSRARNCCSEPRPRAFDMLAGLYMDVHIPAAITAGLRRRDVSVQTSQEDGTRRADDESLLIRTTALDRLLVTYDEDFLRLDAQRQASGRPHSGIAFIAANSGIGRLVEDLELLVLCCSEDELENRVIYRPLK